MNTETKLTAVDLFAGAGGFSLAALNSGFELAFAAENDKFSVETYRDNILSHTGGKSCNIYPEDILSYNPSKIAQQHFATRTCDLLLGGPPCQGFSTHRILDAGVDDPRNELVHAYFNFVKALKPRVFLMENVPGILWDRHASYLERFYAEGKAAGYCVKDAAILDARDYGVPQRRRRVFVLGIRDDVPLRNLVWPPAATHADPRVENKQLKPWAACASVFRSSAKSDENDLHMNHGPDLVMAFKNTPPNGGSRKDSGRILPCHENHDGHKDVYGRIDPSQPAPTMTTACINPSKGRFVHPTEHHGITARQAARIQTFPDDFKFKGGLTAAGRQIGNAVPVDLGTVLITHLKTSLLDQPVSAVNTVPQLPKPKQFDRQSA